MNNIKEFRADANTQLFDLQVELVLGSKLREINRVKIAIRHACNSKNSSRTSGDLSSPTAVI